MKNVRWQTGFSVLLTLVSVSAALAQSAYVKKDTAWATWDATIKAAGERVELGPWYFIGPFDNTGGVGFDAKYPPEAGIDLNASYPGKAKRTLKWQSGARFKDGAENSLNIFDDNDNIVTYVYRTITSPDARDLPVLLGSDDSLKVFLNGAPVLANNTSRAVRLGDDKATLKLHPGKNDLLLKIGQGGGPTGFAFDVDTGSDTLLQRLGHDFPGEINDFLINLDWLRQARSRKASDGGLMAPEDDAPGGCDGVKDGSNDGTGFHTQLEAHPWWQVDLEKPYKLSHALLYNRRTCEERNNDLIMQLSDDGRTWRQAWQNNGTVFYGGKDGKPMRVKLEGQTARYVRLTLPGTQYLHLEEVEVYPADAPEANVALNKPATQSSASPWSTYTPRKTSLSAGEEARIYRRETPLALDLARKTLAFVQQEKALPELAAQLDRLETHIKAAKADDDWRDLYLQVRRLRREIILSHPLLQFKDLVIAKRPPPLYSHMVDQYEGRHSRAGDGVVLLRDWRTTPKVEKLMAGKLPVGSVQHADLSYDGQRVVFSFCDHTPQQAEARKTYLYEMDLPTGKVRQLTGVPGKDPLEGWDGRKTVEIEDFDPCYLPDGGIAFVSTRNQGFGRCHGGRYTPAYVLYRCDADGANITRLSYNESNEWNPGVLPNGSIIYTRWDYVDRNDTLFQSLWTTRPDGTAVEHYYANSTRNPCFVAMARPIPGSELISALATAHHSYSAGSIITVDRRKGEEGLDPVSRVTPEVAFPETEGWPIGSFTNPWPLSENLFLAAYSPDPLNSQGGVARPEGYGIYLVDTLGGRELLYRDPAMSCFCPLPVQSRPMPATVPSVVAPQQADGTFVIQNVYRSASLVPPGTVKRMRIVRIYEQPTAAVAARSVVDTQVVKSVIGTVPVRADGSVEFKAPARTSMLFQLLDDNNMSVMGMRSLVYLQPGETVSCAGCHEQRGSTPPVTRRFATHETGLISPAPGPAYAGGFSFARTVQPVLDRYCIKCHGLDRKAGDVSLLGTRSAEYNEAYDALISRPGLVSLAQRNEQSDVTKPGDYGARAGRLAKMLLTDHRKRAPLDADSFTRIAEWLDLNGQYYGDYSFQRPERQEPSAAGVAALRAQVAKSCGACHQAMAQQPLAALVNLAMPEESRVLQGPLAASAGGWGQCSKMVWSDTKDPAYLEMLAKVVGCKGT